MHEMSLCEGIREILEQQAVQQNYSRVKTVWLEIGQLANIEISAIQFSFAIVMQGSVAEAADLEIIEIPGQAWCFQCLKNIALQHRYDNCPECGGLQLQINDGEQMRIKELAVI